jgi:hypothetical protein
MVKGFRWRGKAAKGESFTIYLIIGIMQGFGSLDGRRGHIKRDV